MTNHKYKYHLKVLYAATKQYADQYFSVSVVADRFYIDKGGAYVFTDSSTKEIACYPTQFTIIEKIETIKND